MQARKRKLSLLLKVTCIAILTAICVATFVIYTKKELLQGIFKRSKSDPRASVLSKLSKTKSFLHKFGQYSLHQDFTTAISEESEIVSDETGKKARCANLADCLDLQRCGQEFLVYVHPEDPEFTISPAYQKILDSIKSSTYHTTDPDSACLFVLSIDTIDRDILSPDYYKNIDQKLKVLPHWNDGQNHVVFNLLSGTWPYYHENLSFNFGKAIIAKASIMHENLRQGFDISIPLYPKHFPTKKHRQYSKTDKDIKRDTNIFPARRKYMLGFKGKRYLTGIGSETRNGLHVLHNDKDIIMLTTCRHGKDWEKHADSRCFKDNKNYERYDYHDLLANSTFCLVPRGRRVGSYRFLETLEYGCIPVSMSNGWDLPFAEVIDWSKFSVSLDERMLLQVPNVIRSFSEREILQMRQQSLFVFHAYFSSVQKIIHTTFEILRERIQPNTKRHYLMWNYPPGGLHVNSKFSPYPTQLPFYNSLLSIIPVQKFTATILAVTPVSRKSSPLFKLIRQINKSKYVEQILIIWLPEYSIPHKTKWPATKVALRVVHPPDKTMGARFIFMNDVVNTDAIFSFDEDANINTSEIDFAFAVWSSNPSRLVGFTSRLHEWNGNTSSWRFSSQQNANFYSMVLTNAAIMHRYYTFMYTQMSLPGVHKLVDEKKTCEGIAMNYLVSHISGESPIKVPHSDTFKYGSRTKSRIGVSFTEETYAKTQQDCFTRLAAIYDYMPLVPSRCIMNPVLYKDPVSISRKKYNMLE